MKRRTLLGLAASAAPRLLRGQAMFKTEVRLVEVYATVFDHRGRYVDGLGRERFRVLEDGRPQPIIAFEADASELSCALLLDTTGSMGNALPVLKNAAVKLIDELRDADAVAVYGFRGSVELLQEFTIDKRQAQQAVLRTRAHGVTALFDAISTVAREISVRKGKKAIVVFTDGEDNSSVLNLQAAVARAKKVGVPVYTVAQGQALEARELVRQLEEISSLSGALSFRAKKSDHIAEVFRHISGDLKHTYLLAYTPPPGERARWRKIEVAVAGVEGRIRAKEGYFAE